MTSITLATFNVENLFTRFKFKGRRVRVPAPPDSGKKFTYKRVPYTPEELSAAVANGFVIESKAFSRSLEVSRKLTAKAIIEIDADIIGLQEVENLDVVKMFNSRYLKSKKYPYQYVIDANDPRFIDVGILSRYPVNFLKTYQFKKSGRSRVFSRDCLQASFEIDGKKFTLFVNHLKSMMGGRKQTKQRRLDQSHAILEILDQQFGEDITSENYAIIGDLNDYIEDNKFSHSGISPLLKSQHLVNVIERLPEDQRWTHFYSREKSYHQLDYIFLSQALANKNQEAIPVIERQGMPLRVNPKNGPKKVMKFFKGIKDELKASDHCPVAITIEL